MPRIPLCCINSVENPSQKCGSNTNKWPEKEKLILVQRHTNTVTPSAFTPIHWVKCISRRRCYDASKWFQSICFNVHVLLLFAAFFYIYLLLFLFILSLFFTCIAFTAFSCVRFSCWCFTVHTVYGGYIFIIICCCCYVCFFFKFHIHVDFVVSLSLFVAGLRAREYIFNVCFFFLLILYFKLWLCVQINEWVKSKVSMEASTWATTVSTNEFASNIYTIWCVIVVFFFLSCGCEQKEREKERTSATHWHDAFANVDTHETNSNQNRTEFGPTRSKC